MEENKISVIIPIYNKAHTLSRAIKSVLNQTYQEFEILVVDDGSKDNPEKIVNDFSNPKIKFFKHSFNKGVSAARNTGIGFSSSPFIAFLDADDEWMPIKLEEQIKIFSNSKDNSLGLVYCGGVFVKDNGKSFTILPSKRGNISKSILLNNYILGGGSTALVKTEVFRSCGLFDENLKIGEDWEMWIRIAEKFTADYVNKALFSYFISPQSATQLEDISRKIEDINYILHKHQMLFRVYSEAHGNILKNIGTLWLYNQNSQKARQYFFKSIKVNPFNFKNIISLPLSFLGSKIYFHVFDLKNKLRQLGVLEK